MKELEKIYKKNRLCIMLMGITGFCFGLLDWDSNLVDLVYLRYNNPLLISIISANIGTMQLIATLFCIKINNSNRPNFIFNTCMLLCALISIITGFCFDNGFVTLFAITYLLEMLILEIFSGYHYAYTYHSLPEDQAMIVHSKRISLFKVLQALGIALAGLICSQFIKNTFLIIAILVTIVFGLTMLLVTQVKNFPKVQEKKKTNLIKKLNIFQYTNYFRKWFIIRFLVRFSLSSLIVLLSLKVIDKGQSLFALKTVKSILWILSGIGFFLSSYFIKKRIMVKGDILVKSLVAILLLVVFIYPNIVFLIILLTGIVNPFNTMSNLEMLRKDKDTITTPQKEMVINLAGYLAKIIASYILLNINRDLALIIIALLLVISVILEYRLYNKTKD